MTETHAPATDGGDAVADGANAVAVGANAVADGANAGADPWYAAGDEPALVELDMVRGLSVSGLGEPGGTEHMSATEALYAVAGALGTPGRPLEGRWWVEDERPALEVPRAEWRWHLFLPATGEITAEQVERACEAVRRKVPAASRVQLAELAEGPSVQMLHRGDYADEPATLGRMYAFMGERNLAPCGLHHEIYLSLGELTILRQPVVRVDPDGPEA